MKIDLLSISGHKIYGPKGIGALYVRRRPRARIAPLIDGGGQERGCARAPCRRRSASASGAACAHRRATRWPDEAAAHPRPARPLPRSASAPRCPAPGQWRSRARRLPGNLNLSFPGVDGARSDGGLPGPSRSRPARPAPRPRSSRPTCCGRSGIPDDLRRRLDPHRARPLQHRRRNRFRGRFDRRRGPPPRNRQGEKRAPRGHIEVWTSTGHRG